MKGIVIGAGISGLAAAWQLARAGCDVTVLERAPRVGGVIDSEPCAGYLLEWGPNSALATSAALVELACDVGLVPVPADPLARHRYVFRGGRLRRLPRGPFSLLATGALGLRAKLRLLAEPWRRVEARPDESVATFFERRFGREFVESVVNPFVSGVYAGSPDELEMLSAFPRIAEATHEAGSVIRGAMRMARAARARPSAPPGSTRGSFSFIDGLEALPAAIAARLGARVQCGVAVESIVPVPVTSPGRATCTWEVRASGGDAVQRADVVILAVPAHAASTLLSHAARHGHGTAFANALASLGIELAAIDYAPVAILQLGVAASALPRALDGFGFLVPARERLDILGGIWASAVFPGRAPPDHHLVTVLAGGVSHRDLLDLPDDALRARMIAGLTRALGGKFEPVFHSLRRLPAAIPQYRPGHAARVSRVGALLADLPTVALAGNYLTGVSLEQAVRSGARAAERVRSPAVVR
ncbi:MAG: protoporphyrinogen oxidase [Planctomycetota bacterium]